MKYRNPHRTRERRSGYLLLTVIVMIAVATLMLGRIANTSMRVASVAIEEEREMRYRWAVFSLRRHSLDAAPRLFSAETEPDGKFEANEIVQPTLWRDVKLAGQTWRVIIGDESAKIDVARISLRFGESTASELIDDILTGTMGIRAAGGLVQVGQGSVGRWESWLNDKNNDPVIDPRTIAQATKDLTLWGDGRLNVRHCDAESLDTLWRLLFKRNAPDELHQSRLASPAPTVNQLIGSLGLRESQVNLAREWLTTRGNCYSLWVFCESDRRVPVTFSVEWGQAESAKIYRTYEY